MDASLRRQEDAVYAEANTRIEAMHAQVLLGLVLCFSVWFCILCTNVQAEIANWH